jgi:hypothetical protein
MSIWRSLLLFVAIGAMSAPAHAQDASQVIAPFFDLMGRAIEQGARQQEIDRYQNSPEVLNQQIQPGGLTRGQVIIVQQLLSQRGYDVGAPDGIIGPKTMGVVAQLQARAGASVDGYPTQQLLDALLQEN